MPGDKSITKHIGIPNPENHKILRLLLYSELWKCISRTQGCTGASLGGFVPSDNGEWEMKANMTWERQGNKKFKSWWTELDHLTRQQSCLKIGQRWTKSRMGQRRKIQSAYYDLSRKEYHSRKCVCFTNYFFLKFFYDTAVGHHSEGVK